ncbi:MAG: sulfatase-like hydrolase/transferase [Lachnospiraceae bacterium]|nr:sulfatase-like hydrolase/transferase [Lachnospiraceae bacterium]
MIEKKNENKGRLEPIYHIMNRFSLLFTALLACVLNFAIEGLSRHSFLAAGAYLLRVPLVFLLNACYIFATLLVAYLFRRRIFIRILISFFWLLLGMTNGYLLLKRVTPFNAQDIRVLSDAITLFGNYSNTMEVIILFVSIILTLVGIGVIYKRGGKYRGKIYRFFTGIVIAIGFMSVSFLTDAAVNNHLVSDYFDNIAFAYEDYGLPYSFTVSMLHGGMATPLHYGQKRIDAITDYGEMNQSKASFAGEKLPNIVVVQLESFFDPTEVNFLRYSRDPIPYLRSLSKEFTSGYFVVPTIGAGTANTEFEVLTGMNMHHFGPGEYPYKTYVKDKPIESAATALASLGYGTYALHNHNGNFYSRAEVYNNMGFDYFVSREMMYITKTTPNGWAEDGALLRPIIAAMDKTKEQDFVFAVTVQSHGEYPSNRIYDNPYIRVTGAESLEEQNAWEYYITQINAVDNFAKHLIQRIEARNEPTVVVFYGDHIPTRGLHVADVKSHSLFHTNYVIWDNIGLEKNNQNIHAYQLMATVFQKLDIQSGTMFNFHQEKQDSPNYLAELEMLQFDLLYGNQYAYQTYGSPLSDGHLQMGIHDIEIEKLTQNLDGSWDIHGANFTKHSRIFVNEKPQKTNFVNTRQLNLPEIEFENGDVVYVAQVGSGNTVFRTSTRYKFQFRWFIEEDVP